MALFLRSFLTHFASKNQPLGLSINGTLAGNGLKLVRNFAHPYLHLHLVYHGKTYFPNYGYWCELMLYVFLPGNVPSKLSILSPTSVINLPIMHSSERYSEPSLGASSVWYTIFVDNCSIKEYEISYTKRQVVC